MIPFTPPARERPMTHVLLPAARLPAKTVVKWAMDTSQHYHPSWRHTPIGPPASEPTRLFDRHPLSTPHGRRLVPLLNPAWFRPSCCALPPDGGCCAPRSGGSWSLRAPGMSARITSWSRDSASFWTEPFGIVVSRFSLRFWWQPAWKSFFKDSAMNWQQ